MKNYQYIQSLLGFGLIKSLLFSLTILSFVGCGEDKVVSEKVYGVVRVDDKSSVEVILPLHEDTPIIYDKNLTKPPKKVIEKKYKPTTKAPIVIKKEIIKKPITTDPLYKQQWYLHEEYGINIDDTWSNYSGKDITVSVVDSGIEALHPDLMNNVDLVRSFRYEDNSSDPSPTQKEHDAPFVDVPHGTSVAGIIGASQNDIGISGIAHEVTLIGLNVFSKPDDSSFEHAIGYRDIDISSNSWGADLSFGLDDDIIVLDAIIEKMEIDPTIYIFASGNEESNSGFSSVLNSRYTLVVGSSTSEGKIASYSNHGANILCVAPGGEDKDNQRIVTTDLIGDLYGYDIKGSHFDIFENKNYDYSDSFYGTSASVPMVSGVVALMLEANLNLGYRDIRYILAHTSRQIDNNHTSWVENSSKILFSNYYGFGLIDAQKAVEMAKDFRLLSDEMVIIKSLEDLNITIVDNDSNGTKLFFDIDENIVLEYVSLELNTDHSYSGDLKIELKSPTDTLSLVAEGGTITEDLYMPWEFGSMQFMDENSKGKWSLNIMDIEENDSGVLNSVTLKLYGHQK